MPESRRSVSWKVFSILVAVAACRHTRPERRPAVAAAAFPEPRIVAWSQGPFASTQVPPGVLIGVVVDASTGAPLPGAQVVVRYESSTLTDSTGRFRITLPRSYAPLEVHYRDYIDATSGVQYYPDSGQVAVFALHRLELRCMLTTGPVRWPGVQVIARDALTGGAPAVFHAWLIPR